MIFSPSSFFEFSSGFKKWKKDYFLVWSVDRGDNVENMFVKNVRISF